MKHSGGMGLEWSISKKHFYGYRNNLEIRADVVLRCRSVCESRRLLLIERMEKRPIGCEVNINLSMALSVLSPTDTELVT